MIKKFSLCTLAICSAFSTVPAWAADSDYQLEQVLMMSRHNLRAPLADNGSLLEQATQKAWPKWDVPGGQLTTKGGVLEVYMGRYTREWLEQQGLAKQGECPNSDAVMSMQTACSAPLLPHSSLRQAPSQDATFPSRIRMRWAAWIPYLTR